jgi:hypothetical protein
MNTSDQYIHITSVGHLQTKDKKCLEVVDAVIGEANSILGGESTIDILIAVSPLLLKRLEGIILQLTSNRRKIRIKVPGFEISDIDSALAKEIANKLVERLSKVGHSDGRPD